ncbi:MAG TPA: 30S ribosomal protein S7 [bacterium]|nr:30S ribosomal protein S7 [bacterium]
MPRKKTKSFARPKRMDPVYHNELVGKLITTMMWSGKANKCEQVVYEAFDIIKEKLKTEPLPVFEKAMENIKPVLEVRSRRVGGANYQVPVEVRPERRLTLAFRWLIGYARERKEPGMARRLAGELMDAFNNQGGAIKKKEDTFKMAEANRAFAHYRW